MGNDHGKAKLPKGHENMTWPVAGVRGSRTSRAELSGGLFPLPNADEILSRRSRAVKSRALVPLTLKSDEMPDGISRLESVSASGNQEDDVKGLDSDTALDNQEGGAGGLESDSASDNEDDCSNKSGDRKYSFSKFSTRSKTRKAKIQHDSGSLAKEMGTVLVMENEEKSQNVAKEHAVVERYKMERHPRGYAIIINNVNFEDGDERKGSDLDAERLVEVFSKANFTVILKRNVKSHEIFKTLRTYSADDHSNFDAFVCCILSHGSEGRVNGIDKDSIKIRSLVDLYEGIHCPSLAGKPKLFFIQACQGHADHPVVKIQQDNIAAGQRCVPAEADFLIAVSTVPGYYSYRDVNEGSWYIQSFAKHFTGNYKNTHLMDILTLVSHDVSKDRQMPIVNSTLCKHLYF